MTRKNKLLQDFLEHPIIKEKYNISERRIPDNIEEGMRSSSPIIKALSHIINEVEKFPRKNEREVEQLIRKLLNVSPS